MTYEILEEFPVESPEWHEQRRHTLGASEVAAVLGLSRFQTPLGVYRTKMGAPHEIPENLSYFGRAMEPVMAQWVRDKHPEVGPVLPGFAARNPQCSWLSASPDRVTDSAGVLHPLELKNSSEWSRKEWDNGVPDYYKIQSLVQQLVLGAHGGHLAVLHGGNRPDLYRVPWDQDAVNQIIELTQAWWLHHVVAQVPPEPSTLGEVEAVQFNSGNGIDGDDRLLMAWYLDGLQRSTYKEAEEGIEAVKAAYKELLSHEHADELRFEGRPLYTWRRSKDAEVFDRERFTSDHPDLAARYSRTVPGSLRFLRKSVKDFEADPPPGWAPGMRVADVLEQYADLTIWKKEPTP